MKKNALLILLAAFTLTGCDLDLGFIKLDKTEELNQIEVEKGENNQEKPEETEKEDDGENTTNHEEHTNPQDEEHSHEEEHGQEHTVTINVSGHDFSSIATSAGYQTDKDDYPEHQTALKNYFISKLGKESLLTSLTCTKLNTSEWLNVCYLCVGTGYYINGKFNEGIINWASTDKIYKVEIKAQAYAKENSYSGNIIDKKAHICIDSDDHTLEVEQESELEFHTFSKSYEEGTNSFSIKSTGGRVLLESISITWIS